MKEDAPTNVTGPSVSGTGPGKTGEPNTNLPTWVKKGQLPLRHIVRRKMLFSEKKPVEEGVLGAVGSALAGAARHVAHQEFLKATGEIGAGMIQGYQDRRKRLDTERLQREREAAREQSKRDSEESRKKKAGQKAANAYVKAGQKAANASVKSTVSSVINKKKPTGPSNTNAPSHTTSKMPKVNKVLASVIKKPSMKKPANTNTPNQNNTP